jgi:HD superfamily phosphohydrolase
VPLLERMEKGQVALAGGMTMGFEGSTQPLVPFDHQRDTKVIAHEVSDAVVADHRRAMVCLSPAVRRLIALPSFVRLARIRQLGFLSWLWPQATHTRYDHSLGCYALAQQTIQSLLRWYPILDEQAALAFQLASLLHDLGHYAFAHCLEEIGPPLPSHEQVGRQVIEHSEIATFIEREYQLSPGRIADLVDPPQSWALPAEDAWLASLLSGALDIDKLDYLPRDARACQVSYGYIDVPQLLACLRVVQSAHGQPLVALDHKGVGALAAFLHARQAMYLTVYGHPQNRACQAMLRRAVQDALLQETITAEQVTHLDDNALLRLVAGDDQPRSTQLLAHSLARQHIYGEVLEISPAAHRFSALVTLIEDTWQRRRVEQHLADALRGLLERDIHDYEVLLDIPRAKSWEMEGWLWYDSPPIGCQELVPWRSALGLCSADLKRYEDARRPIRVFASARVREWLSPPSRRQLIFSILEELATSGREPGEKE